MHNALALAAFIGFATGIAVGSILSFSLPSILFSTLLGITFSLAWFFGRRDAYLLPALFMLLFALGAGRTMLIPRVLPAAFTSMLDTPVTLVGTIVADPDVRETNQRLTVAVADGGARTDVLAVVERYPEFEAGDTVSVSGTLTLPQAFSTDGGRTFDYRMFLAKDGVLAMLPHAHVERTGITKSFPLLLVRYLYAGKHAFSHALEAALPEPHASLAEGLITGGKQGLGTALLAAFTVTGLLPIVVLSGYNVMIVAESLLAALSFLPKRFALSIAGLAVLLFILAAGGGSSALRAGVMAGLALFARATGRTYDALRALAAAFVFMLLVNPLSLVYDPGFQFSFVATLGLIVASSLFAVRLSFIRANVLREILATTLAAQLFVLPLVLYQTGNLSLVSVVANVLVLSIVPLAMGLSAVAGVGALIMPFFAPYIGLPAYAALSYITLVAETMAQLPFAHLVVPAFPFFLTLGAYALIGWFIVWIRKTTPGSVVPRPIPVRAK